MVRAALALLLTGSLLLCTAQAARADEKDGCPDADARIAFVGERLDADAHGARVWMWGWGLGYTGLALGQAGLALTRDDEGERVELYVGAAKSVLGLVPVLLVRSPALHDAGTLKVRAAGGGSDRCAVAAEAGEMLERSAADEAFARSFLAHTANVLVNGGGMLIVGLGYDRWVTGALGAAVGIAIGEVNIFTRPTAALRGRADYAARWTVAPVVTGDATGILLIGTF